jgi:hypothetical protein
VAPIAAAAPRSECWRQRTWALPAGAASAGIPCP